MKEGTKATLIDLLTDFTAATAPLRTGNALSTRITQIVGELCHG
jgi:hypothetical protein